MAHPLLHPPHGGHIHQIILGNSILLNDSMLSNFVICSPWLAWHARHAPTTPISWRCGFWRSSWKFALWIVCAVNAAVKIFGSVSATILAYPDLLENSTSRNIENSPESSFSSIEAAVRGKNIRCTIITFWTFSYSWFGWGSCLGC